MQLNDILLHLSLIEGIGPVVIQKILKRMPMRMQLSNIYHLYTSDFVTLFGIPEQTAAVLVTGLKDTRLFDREKELIKKHAISVVTIFDDEYPALLKTINVPPVVLYYRGILPLGDNENTLAVVGARKANFYGFDVLKGIIPELVADDITIVSGGALGIDAVAHEQAICSGGKTIAVLGSGLLQLYPASNGQLFESIVQSGGALISSFPLRMEARPGHFPARNRIISGLSRGCLVVQAAKKSGALITARYALEQGREVFAIPGPIDSVLSAGCHGLIRDGATLVASAFDIAEVLVSDFTHQRLVFKQGEVVPSAQQQSKEQVVLEEDVPEDSTENKIKQLCSTPKSLDDLADLTGFSLEELHNLLFQLQLKGQLQQDFMGLWQRI